MPLDQTASGRNRKMFNIRFILMDAYLNGRGALQSAQERAYSDIITQRAPLSGFVSVCLLFLFLSHFSLWVSTSLLPMPLRSVIFAMDDPEELPWAAFQAPWGTKASTYGGLKDEPPRAACSSLSA